MKAAGMDILNPSFGDSGSSMLAKKTPTRAAEVSMKNPKVSRQITVEEVKGHDPKKPWVIYGPFIKWNF